MECRGREIYKQYCMSWNTRSCINDEIENIKTGSLVGFTTGEGQFT